MSYRLGIDLGTVFSVAAITRDGVEQAVDLGSRATAVPSVIYLDPDGSFRVGDDAVRRLVSEPERTAREFKRRFGDPTPFILGGSPVAAEALQAELLRSIVALVTARMGEPPRQIVVTHPANWGPFKRELMAQMVRLAGLDSIELLTEPEAAALHYADSERVEPGDAVAVYDLGGGTFDAVVLTRTAIGYEITGEAGGLEHLGGADFDQAVLTHVIAALGDDFPAEDDPQRATLASILRRECVEAKEALSTDTSVVISVPLAAGIREVRLTRAELEDMIRAPLTRTVSELSRVIRRAGLEPRDLKKVLLVGGSSRIPLVARMLTEALGVPVAVDVDPKLAVAKGAALHAATIGGGTAARLPVVAPPAPAPSDPLPSAPAAAAVSVPSTAAATGTTAASTAPTEVPTMSDAPTPPPPRIPTDRKPQAPMALVAVGLLIAAAVLGWYFLIRNDDGKDTNLASGPTTGAGATAGNVPSQVPSGGSDGGDPADGPGGSTDGDGTGDDGTGDTDPEDGPTTPVTTPPSDPKPATFDPSTVDPCELVTTDELDTIFKGDRPNITVTGAGTGDSAPTTSTCTRTRARTDGSSAYDYPVVVAVRWGSAAIADFRKNFGYQYLNDYPYVAGAYQASILVDDQFVVQIFTTDTHDQDGSAGFRRALEQSLSVAATRASYLG